MDDWLDVMAGSDPDRLRARQSLLAIAEEVSGSGSFAWRADSEQLVWSANLRRLWQIEAEPAAPLAALYARVHADDLFRVRGWVQRVRSGDPPPAIHFRIRLPDDGVRFMEASIARREDGAGASFFVGWIRDVTQNHQAEREIACHLAVAEVLGGWDAGGASGEEGIMRLLESLAHSLELPRASLWTLGDAGRVSPRYLYAPQDRPGVPITGELLTCARRCVEVAWRTRRPLWIGGLAGEPGIPSGDLEIWETIRDGALVPVTNGTDVLAVIGLPGLAEFEITTRLMATLAGVGSEIGAFLSAHTTLLTPSVLSPRELEILRLASQGLSGPTIAERLVVSPATVKTHFEHIYVKYDVPDRVAAVAKAIREGLIA